MARKPGVTTAAPAVVVTTAKCNFSGDPDDEYCGNCNGITMKIEEGGPDISCKECGGYAPSEEIEQEPEVLVPEVELPINKPTAKPVVAAKPVVETIKPAVVTPAVTVEKVVEQDNTPVAGTNYIPSSKTTEIRADSGASVEVKGKWYKFMYGETRTISADANVAIERELLWEDVNSEIDSQIEQVINL